MPSKNFSKTSLEKTDNDSLTFTGISASAGIAIGRAVHVGKLTPDVKEIILKDEEIDQELERFQEAIQKSSEQLLTLRNQAAEIIGAEAASIFDAHLMLVEDKAIVKDVNNQIRERGRNAEFIFQEVIHHYCTVLENIDDAYIRDRLIDIQDVATRIINNLQEDNEEQLDLQNLKAKSILVANDLSPSDTAGMDKENVLAFITAAGSKTSHTAIVARSLHIPAVAGAGKAVNHIKNGDLLIVDGIRGKVVVNPTNAELCEYRLKHKSQQTWYKNVEKEAKLPAETIDGFRVQLAANIELPQEIDTMRQDIGVGIGLFRTEFIFINKTHIPTEEEQFQEYKKVVQDIYPNSVIIRTLDIGGDKFVSHLKTPNEMNPFLGVRAIRFCLAQPDIFMDQLRAILRASAYGKVRIMFPMISTVEELLQAIEYLDKAKKELDERGISYNPHLDVGTMIEVPAAAIIADKLAPYLDFFSIGTNDLVQYSLATDRANPEISYLYQPGHPSVIHLIQNVVQAAYNHGKWVGLCGQMGSDPLMVPLVLGLGIHELSMSPIDIPLIKRLIRRIRLHDAEQLVENALQCSTAGEVEVLCHDFLKEIMPDYISG